LRAIVVTIVLWAIPRAASSAALQAAIYVAPKK
jgi:hypothetical protein